MKLIIPNLPEGIRFDHNGLVFDLNDQKTVNLLRAAFYQTQVLQDAVNEESLADFKALDPQVATLLDQISKGDKK